MHSSYLDLLAHEHFGQRHDETHEGRCFDNECSSESNGNTMTEEMKCSHLMAHGGHIGHSWREVRGREGKVRRVVCFCTGLSQIERDGQGEKGLPMLSLNVKSFIVFMIISPATWT